MSRWKCSEGCCSSPELADQACGTPVQVCGRPRRLDGISLGGPAMLLCQSRDRGLYGYVRLQITISTRAERHRQVSKAPVQ